MKQVYITTTGEIIVLYDDGTVDRPKREADGRVVYKYPSKANPFIRANVIDAFLTLEPTTPIYEE